MVQLEAKQKARKKEERQSLMGKYWQACFWEVAPLPHPTGEETEAQRRVGAELGAGPALKIEMVVWALACCAQGGVSKTMQNSRCRAILGSRGLKSAPWGAQEPKRGP